MKWKIKRMKGEKMKKFKKCMVSILLLFALIFTMELPTFADAGSIQRYSSGGSSSSSSVNRSPVFSIVMVAVACYVVKILLHQIRHAQGCDGGSASCHQFRDDERTAAEQGVFRFVTDGDGLTREGFGKFVEHEVEIAGRLHREGEHVGPPPAQIDTCGGGQREAGDIFTEGALAGVGQADAQGGGADGRNAVRDRGGVPLCEMLPGERLRPRFAGGARGRDGHLLLRREFHRRDDGIDRIAGLLRGVEAECQDVAAVGQLRCGGGIGGVHRQGARDGFGEGQRDPRSFDGMLIFSTWTL